MLVVGYGLAGRAVARALTAHGTEAVVVDDNPSDGVRAAAKEAGVTVLETPSTDDLAELISNCDAVVPSPGVPDRHPVFALAAERDVEVISEFDLASRWDSRPTVVITGTDGKTTVTTMVEQMLLHSGQNVVAAGNNDLPLVSAISDPKPEIFVVEASSFRLGHSREFAPSVGTWINFGPDHLDVHADLHAYELAKASIWSRTNDTSVAIANASDPVVMAHVPSVGRVETFSERGPADHHVSDGELILGGDALLAVADLPRTLPHDIANALAAAATALAAGATREGAAEGLRTFVGLKHRVENVGSVGGITYFDDSKATTPHAASAAISSFESVVLIAGGRNKGLDLSPIADQAERIRAVVAIGDAGPEVAVAFEGKCPTMLAGSMSAAVERASEVARPGDVVLLSPGCASFDWYSSYAARGDDFAQCVSALNGGTP